jgi:hypothetical protein
MHENEVTMEQMTVKEFNSKQQVLKYDSKVESKGIHLKSHNLKITIVKEFSSKATSLTL